MPRQLLQRHRLRHFAAPSGTLESKSSVLTTAETRCPSRKHSDSASHASALRWPMAPPLRRRSNTAWGAGQHWSGTSMTVTYPSTTAVERNRPVALGRSNWLFAGSLRADQRAAAIVSLIQPAKLDGHNLPNPVGEPHRRAPPHRWQSLPRRRLARRVPRAGKQMKT